MYRRQEAGQSDQGTRLIYADSVLECDDPDGLEPVSGSAGGCGTRCGGEGGALSPEDWSWEGSVRTSLAHGD